MATYGTTNKYINYSVNSQELSYDINSNTSVVRVWVDCWRTNTGYETYGSGTVTVWCDGQTSSASITSAQRITSTPIRILDAYFPVGHSADGSKTAYISGQISHSRFSSGNNCYNHVLNTIPRQANITSCSDFTDQQNPSLTYYNPGNWNMECWLEPNPNGEHYAIRTLSGTGGTFTWDLTDEERNQLRTACKGKSCVCRIGLYSNNKQWASYYDRTFTIVNAPPSFDGVTVQAVNPFGSLYLQSKSSAKFTINGAKGIYGSEIVGYSISGGDYNYTGDKNTYTTGVLTKAGNIEFTATITDSRGFTASKKVTVKVTEYTYPTLSIEAYRCTSAGVKDIAKGTYIAVKATFTYCTITGNSIKSKYIKINGTSKSTAFNSGSVSVFGTYALNQTHTIEVSVTDAVGNSIKVQTEITIGKIPLIIPIHKNGLGAGRFCTVEGQFQVGFDLNLFGSFMINDQEQPVFELVETIDVEI